jgi:hypothetical protein
MCAEHGIEAAGVSFLMQLFSFSSYKCCVGLTYCAVGWSDSPSYQQCVFDCVLDMQFHHDVCYVFLGFIRFRDLVLVTTLPWICL